MLERQQRERVVEKLERARRRLLRRLDVEVDGERRMKIRAFLNQINYFIQHKMDDLWLSLVLESNILLRIVAFLTRC